MFIVQVMWHNFAKKGPDMGVAVPQAPLGGWGPGPLKRVLTGPSFLVNCNPGNKFHNEFSPYNTSRRTPVLVPIRALLVFHPNVCCV